MALAHTGQLPIAKPGKRGGRDASQRLFLWATLLPMAVIFVVFWIYPLASGLWGSFTDWQAFQTEQEFVGLRHYRNLFQDDVFLESVRNTFAYALMYLPLSIVVSLGLALAIEASGKMKSVFRTIYFAPVVTSVIATALVWKWLYQPTLGLFNQLLNIVGLPSQGFLQDPGQALPSIVLYSLWKNLGFTMVLFIAGLNGIDRAMYEAAMVDGANRWRVFWGMTLPLLRPTMVFVVVTGIIDTLQVFGPVFIMSSVGANSPPGGPSNSTMVVAVYQWTVAFGQLNLGYGMAMGIVLFGIVLVVTLAQSRFLRNTMES